jgi:hypothetical protein
MSLSVNFLFWLRPKPQFLLYLALLLGFNSDSKNNYFLINIVITINFYSIKINFFYFLLFFNINTTNYLKKLKFYNFLTTRTMEE